MFGYDSFEDIEGMSLLDMVGPQHVEDFKQLLKSLSKGEPPPPRHELEARDIEGNAFPASMEFTQAQYEGEACLQVVFRRQELDSELAHELEALRQRDQVTGLLNRPTFLRALEDAVDDAAQNNGQHGLLIVEPDHYQRLLQDIGLDSADDMLAAIAERLRGVLGDKAIAARFTEHTLAVLLKDSEYDGTVALAERIRDAFAAHLFPIGSAPASSPPASAACRSARRSPASRRCWPRPCRAWHRYWRWRQPPRIFDPSAVDRAEEEHIGLGSRACATRSTPALRAATSR